MRSVATKDLVADSFKQPSMAIVGPRYTSGTSRPFVVAQGDIFLDRKSRVHLDCRWFSFLKSHITIYDVLG